MAIHNQGTTIPKSLDFTESKNKKIGLTGSERYFYLTAKGLQATKFKDGDKFYHTALKTLGKAAVILASVATLPLGLIIQPIVGHTIHHKQIKDVKTYVDPILKQMYNNPLKPQERKEIKDRTGLNVSFAVNSIREHDQLLTNFDKDFLGQEISKQADNIAQLLQNTPEEKQASLLKNIVEAVITRQSLYDNISIEKREETAQNLYEAVVDRFIDAETEKQVTSFISNPQTEEFAKNVDALTQHIAQFLNIDEKEAREIVHSAYRNHLEAAEEALDCSIEDLATNSEQASKSIDSNKNALVERAQLLKQEFSRLVKEKDHLKGLKHTYLTNKSIQEMKTLLKSEIRSINKERTKLEKQMSSKESKFKKSFNKPGISSEEKNRLEQENKTTLNEYTQAITALNQQEKALLDQMSVLDQNQKTSDTPYDQRITEIDVELSKIYDQMGKTYESLVNYSCDVEIQKESFKRVMALIHDEAEESIDYSKSLEEIAYETALEIYAENLFSDDLQLEKKQLLTSYDSFKEFYTSVAPGSSSARAALQIFLDKADFTPEQKDRFIENIAKEVGFEHNLLENGEGYLSAYINGEETFGEVKVLPSVIYDAVISDEAKSISENIVTEDVVEISEPDQEPTEESVDSTTDEETAPLVEEKHESLLDRLYSQVRAYV